VVLAAIPVVLFVAVFWPVQGLGEDTDFLASAFPVVRGRVARGPVSSPSSCGLLVAGLGASPFSPASSTKAGDLEPPGNRPALLRGTAESRPLQRQAAAVAPPSPHPLVGDGGVGVVPPLEPLTWPTARSPGPAGVELRRPDSNFPRDCRAPAERGPS
jgi:hypothetical protein